MWPAARMEEAVNHLTNSQSTAKTMADGGAIPDYCTLPRLTARLADSAERQQAPDRSVNGGHYYTLRPKPNATMGAVGGRLKPTVGSFRKVQTAEDLAESNRSLLYEQNMSTFENFCERRNSERQLRPDQTEESSELGPDSLGNFCTLRKVRRVRSGAESSGHVQHDREDRRGGGPLGGAYCTLKKKKLQLNRKFVESFLEDPNAKVVDYLSELDAYLDEMDGGLEEMSDEAVSDGDSASNASEDAGNEPQPECKNERKLEEEAGVVGESLQYYQPDEVRASVAAAGEDSESGVKFNDAYQEDRIKFGDIKHFCTLPKQKRTQFLNAFKRGASLRRSVVSRPKANTADDSERTVSEAGTNAEIKMECGEHMGAMHNTNEPQASNGNSLHRWNESDSPHHHASWHRSSMRKKHLIELPEQDLIEHGPSPTPAVAATPSSSAASNESLLEANELSSICTLPVDEVPASEPLDLTGHPALVVALPPSPGPFLERSEREQIVASAPPASPQPPLLETDLDEIVQERPRQAGRRAQSQPRIGSITVVRDAATNELIIRTNSVQGESPTAPPMDELRQSHHEIHHLQQQQQQQHRQHLTHHHHGRYGAESEGSSIGSSRNPSPVSLLSTTTTCSSIASGPDNATDRTHRTSEQPNDGTTEAGSSPFSRGVDLRDEVSTTGSSSVPIRSSTSGRRHRNTSEPQRRSTSTPTAQTEPTGTSAGQDDGRTTAGEDESDTEASPQRGSSRRSDGRPKARWPHAISRSLATTFCTVGLFNISRFAVFSVHFGANFVVQFLIFSLLFGIPMLWLQMVLGARIRGGPVTMWRISPICKGIGIALLLAQALITLYSAISLAWVLVYFRDAFITRNEKYRWQEKFDAYHFGCPENQSYRLPDTVADYFNGVVLQRYHLAHQSPVGSLPGYAAPPPSSRSSGIGAIRFQLAFNLAIIWTFVFIALCRGIRSLGKIAIGTFLGAFATLTAVCAKFLTFINYDSVQNIFPATDWQDFFLNSRSWTSAAQETFLTWGLLGVSIYALNCRSHRKGSYNVRTRRELRRDAFLVAFFTLTVLMLAAVLGSACVQILNTRGYYYFPGSYENLGTNVFLRSANQPLPPQHATMPNRWLLRYSTVVGESFKRSYADPNRESGYQPLRLVTELLPAALAAATPENITPIWGMIGYLALVLFGLGQLCVLWKPIAGAVGDAPSSILLSCVTALLLGMPLATEGGINIVHYLDTILGAAWWLLLLWIGHIMALFLVRGRPFTSDILVNDLQVLQSFSAFVAFAWNFLLPIGLIFLCIMQYRLSNSAALFNWSSSTVAAAATSATGASNYWPLWARQVGGFLQISFLLLVPIVMVIQIYRYLCRGPPDILDRVDLLLRPPVDDDPSPQPFLSMQTRRMPVQRSSAGGGATTRDGTTDPTITISLDSRSVRDADDAPPKYTPPPSYTTATGARIAKLLRNSIRRSVRRLMGETSGTGSAPSVRQRAALPQTADDGQAMANPSTGDELPPPDYCSALQQFGGPLQGGFELNHHPAAAAPRILYNSATLGSGRRYRSLNATGDTAATQHSNTSQQQSFTASDVRQILRPTGTAHQPSANSAGFTQTLRNTLLRRGHSMENLVLAAAPLGDSSIITLNGDEDEDERGGNSPSNGRDSVI